MLRRMLLVLVLVAVAVPAFGQIVDTAWVRTWANAYYCNIAACSSGNIVACGTFFSGENAYYCARSYYANGDTVWSMLLSKSSDYSYPYYTIDSHDNLYLIDSRSMDCIAAKILPSGDTAWYRIYHNSSNPSYVARGHSIAADDTGNVYIVGEEERVVNKYQIFIRKYYSNGDMAWTRIYWDGNAITESKALYMAIDHQGNVIISGIYDDGLGLFSDNILVLKYSPAGTLLWHRIITNSGNDQPSKITIDDLDNIYITGNLADGNGGNLITAKYSPTGNLIWSFVYSGPGALGDNPIGIVVDSSYSAYVTGSASLTNGISIITIKYTPDGDTAWSRSYSAPQGYGSSGRGIAMDMSGYIYVSGNYIHDLVTIKYDSDGNMLWAMHFGDGQNLECWGMEIDHNENVYLAGRRTTANHGSFLIKYLQIIPGAISGFVTSASDDSPISQAIVKAKMNGIEVLRDTTDLNGNYLIPFLRPGNYSLELTRVGFVYQEVNNINVLQAETTIVDIQMAPYIPLPYVTGDVNNTNSFTGLDITYSVRFFKGSPPPPYSADCPPHGTWYVAGDVNGSCSFSGLDITYMVRFFKGGPAPIPCPDCPPVS
jgi:hypothetical protein